MQLLAVVLGGNVEAKFRKKEYGLTKIQIKKESPMTRKPSKTF